MPKINDTAEYALITTVDSDHRVFVFKSADGSGRNFKLRDLNEVNGGFTVNGELNVGDGSTSATSDINGAAETNRFLRWQTNGSLRWGVTCNTVAESGSNVGSNWQLIRYDDAGISMGANITIVRSSGNMTLSNDLSVTGAISKGSGSFRIDHPLKPDTHHLVHSFVEAPTADNRYTGMVTLVAGKAEVNLDEAAGMSDGTFVALNRNIRRHTKNESGFTPVKSSISGNILTITAKTTTCTDEVFWEVIGERQDQHMYDTEWTDDEGRVIVEPEKENDS